MRFYIIKILEEREETIKEIIQENFPHAPKKASSEKKNEYKHNHCASDMNVT